MILADSGVWIDHFSDRQTPQTTLLRRTIVDGWALTGGLIVAEVLRGARTDDHAEKLARVLASLPMCDIGDLACGLAAAENYRRLRALGRTVRGTIDCLIATRCIMDGNALLYADRDFDPFVEHLGLRSAMANG